jgi:SAM-dependent methyltransferase
MAKGFSTVEGYEQVMGRWSTGLAPPFLRFAGVKDGGKTLDVGCGTGSLTNAFANMCGHSQIVGIDLSQPFIDYCCSRFSGVRYAFDLGSALELPYADNTFDQTLSLLVIMFIPRPEKAASEMYRVTRPGGTVAACTWSEMKMSQIFWDEAAQLDPAAEARADRPRQLNRDGQLTELWRAAGLQDVAEAALDIQMEFSSFDDYWKPIARGAGPLGAYVAALALDAQDALREAVWKKFLGNRDGPFALPARALAVRGTVPI